jgi:hypothetical protein
MKSKNTPFTFANSLCFSCKREEKICEGTCGQYAHIGFKDVQRSEATLVKTKQKNDLKPLLNNVDRVIPGRLGFKSTVNCTAARELSFSLVPSTALESPIFPRTRL